MYTKNGVNKDDIKLILKSVVPITIITNNATTILVKFLRIKCV